MIEHRVTLVEAKAAEIEAANGAEQNAAEWGCFPVSLDRRSGHSLINDAASPLFLRSLYRCICGRGALFLHGRGIEEPVAGHRSRSRLILALAFGPLNWRRGLGRAAFSPEWEGRRVGKECGVTCRSRWVQDNEKKKKQKN